MLSLNLLPWRLEQHQKAFKRFMWQGLIWLACSVLIVFGLSHLNEQQVYVLNQTKEKLAQITNQVHKKRIQVQQLQSNLKEMNELTEMDTEYVYRMLNLLSELPLQQGELDVFCRLITHGVFAQVCSQFHGGYVRCCTNVSLLPPHQ